MNRKNLDSCETVWKMRNDPDKSEWFSICPENGKWSGKIRTVYQVFLFYAKKFRTYQKMLPCYPGFSTSEVDISLISLPWRYNHLHSGIMLAKMGFKTAIGRIPRFPHFSFCFSIRDKEKARPLAGWVSPTIRENKWKAMEARTTRGCQQWTKIN